MQIIFEKDDIFRGDLVPLIDFVDFFSKREGWEEHITNPNSLFMRMMQLDEILIRRKLVHLKPGTGYTDSTKEKAKILNS